MIMNRASPSFRTPGSASGSHRATSGVPASVERSGRTLIPLVLAILLAGVVAGSPMRAQAADDEEVTTSEEPDSTVPDRPVRPPRNVDRRPAADRDDDEPATSEAPAEQPAPPARAKPSAAQAKPVDRSDDDDNEAPGASVDSAQADQAVPAVLRDPCMKETAAWTTFHAKSDKARTIVVALSGAVPKVGGLVSGAIKFLWKDVDNYSAVFDQMREYVDKLIPEMISREHVHKLEQHVSGLRSAANNYVRTTNLLQKGEYLTSMLTVLDAMEPEFFDDRAPEKVLAHFVAFGTLKLAALREQYLFAPDYYGGDEDRESHFQLLQQQVGRYTGAAAGIRTRALAWRMGKIKCERGSEQKSRTKSAPLKWRWLDVHDELCGWQQRYRGNWWAVSTALIGGHGDPGEPKFTPSQTFCTNRQDLVRRGFTSDLDAIVEPINHWAALATKVDLPGPARTRTRDDRRPDATAIMACSKSAEPAVRKGRTEAGVRCRRENIEKFLMALSIVKGSYSTGALEACLKGLEDELAGRGEGEGGAGPEYFRKLNGCSEEAKREKIAFSVDSATADNDDSGDRKDADCDARCAGELFRRIHAEQSRAGAGQGGRRMMPASRVPGLRRGPGRPRCRRRGCGM